MYLGQVGLGLLMLFTFGFCGIAQLLDLFLIPSAVQNSNRLIAGSQQVEGGDSGAQNEADRSSAPSRRASYPSSDVAQDDDLEFLLKQAEKSVERTEAISGDD